MRFLRVLGLLPVFALLGGCDMVLMNPSGDIALQERNLIIASTGLMLLIIVPVIVLTAKDVTPEERAWLDRRAERLILKGSVSLNELAHEVRDLVPAPEENSRERPPPAAGRPA